jgi:ABC-type antimicrobial peptide transport system permease subunit
MRKRDIRGFFLLQAAAVSLLGAAIGIGVAVALPSFLPQETAGTSIFMLQIPADIAAAGAAICMVVGLFSMVMNRNCFISKTESCKTTLSSYY